MPVAESPAQPPEPGTDAPPARESAAEVHPANRRGHVGGGIWSDQTTSADASAGFGTVTVVNAGLGAPGVRGVPMMARASGRPSPQVRLRAPGRIPSNTTKPR
ncbi:hypothetical protein Acsp05_25440 [Actinokineospora sp. NBRC 105648]|nr:hypothetical protein Acsp05_25440 [Actinokineospora sp. NBRC 105648]